jgi:hypothetical protein
MVSAKVDVGTTLRVTETEVLFDATRYWSDRAAQQYDVEPGDRRFLMLQRMRGSTRSLVVVWNWLDGVKERFEEEARIR